MATIEEAITLIDGASKVLQEIAYNADATSNSISETNKVTKQLESSMNSTSGAIGQVESSFKSLVGQFTAGNLIASAVTRIGETIAEIPQKVMKASDKYAGMVARLKLVTGSAEEANEMNDRIYASALRARGSYNGMLDSVSKLAMTAKEAFPDAKQVVPFVEGIQKLFAVAGTGMEQQKSAMFQLTQAMGRGVLMGNDFTAIAEAAPLIEQMVAKEMGITQGQLKELSSKGVITADIIKQAILGNMDEINADFQNMPKTWGSIFTNLGTVFTKAMVPVYNAVSELANSSGLQTFISGFSSVLPVIGAIAGDLVNGLFTALGMVGSAAAYVSEWLGAGIVMAVDALNALAPLISVVGGLYVGWLSAIAVNWLIVNGMEAAHNAIMRVTSAWQTIMTVKTRILTDAIKAQAIAQMLLRGILALNPIGLVIGLVVAAIGVFMAWKIHTVGLKNAMADAFGTMASVVQTAVNFMIGAINGLIKMLNAAAGGINKVFGTHISTVAEVSYTQGDWGQSARNWVLNGKIGDLLPKVSLPDQNLGVGEYGGFDSSTLGNIADTADAGKQTAENTGRMADAIDALDEDLKYLREVSERQLVEKYTTVPVTVHVGGITNNVASDMDLDGVVDRLTAGIRDGIANSVQEVHI